MKKDDNGSELRRQAEERLKKSSLIHNTPSSAEELQRMVQELSLHQIELEMQNEELQDSRSETEREHNRYLNLYDFAPVGYLTLARDGTIREANLTIARMLSVERSKLKGRMGGFDRFVAHQDLPVFNSMVERVFQSRTLEHCEIMIGRIFFRLDAIISDNPQEYRLSLTDISDTRNALDALKKKEEQYRCLFEAAQEGIMILDYKSGEIVDANPYIAHLMGFSLDEIIGKELWEIGFILDKELAQKAYLELQTKRYIRYSDLPLQHKSGKVIDVEFISYVYNVGEEKAIQCTIRDITQQKQLREYEKRQFQNEEKEKRTAELVLANKELLFQNEEKETRAAELVLAITAQKDGEQKILSYVKQLENAMQTTLQAVAKVVEAHDPYTAGHELRVGQISEDIAREMGWSEEKCNTLRLIGLVHDIGKMSIPSEILSKPGKLSAIEFELVKTHAEQGYQILHDVEFPLPIAEIIREHHERMDGSGYPQGLKGEEILIESRILAVADVLEAMASNRPYRASLGIEAAISEIESHRGSLFDPDVADAMLRLFRERGYQLPA